MYPPPPQPALDESAIKICDRPGARNPLEVSVPSEPWSTRDADQPGTGFTYPEPLIALAAGVRPLELTGVEGSPDVWGNWPPTADASADLKLWELAGLLPVALAAATDADTAGSNSCCCIWTIWLIRLSTASILIVRAIGHRPASLSRRMDDFDLTERLITAAEFATMLRVTEDDVLEWMLAGHIPYVEGPEGEPRVRIAEEHTVNGPISSGLTIYSISDDSTFRAELARRREHELGTLDWGDVDVEALADALAIRDGDAVRLFYGDAAAPVLELEPLRVVDVLSDAGP